MKKTLAACLLLISFQALADSQLICTAFRVKKITAIAKEHSEFDKNRHCTVSCMLTLKCGASEALLVGGLKEVRDALGYGEASWEDFKADEAGVRIGVKKARDNQECLDECDLIYNPQALEISSNLEL